MLGNTWHEQTKILVAIQSGEADKDDKVAGVVAPATCSPQISIIREMPNAAKNNSCSRGRRVASFRGESQIPPYVSKEESGI